MIKVTFGDILGVKDFMSRLSQSSLPISIAHRVSKMIRGLQDELSFIEKERNKIFAEFNVTEENGNVNFANNSDRDIVNARWTALMVQEVELNCDKVNLVPVKDDPAFRITPVEVEIIEKFVVLEPETAVQSPKPEAAE